MLGFVAGFFLGSVLSTLVLAFLQGASDKEYDHLFMPSDNSSNTDEE